MNDLIQQHGNHAEEKKLEYLKEKGYTFKIYQSKNYAEVICQSRKFTFAKMPEYRPFLNVFRNVEGEALKFIEKNGVPRVPNDPPNEVNPNFPEDALIGGADIDHAFWRIAYNEGIISKNTYSTGLKAPKRLRLTTLAKLGRSKRYEIWKGYERLEDEEVKPENKDLIHLYLYIRGTCFRYMQELKHLLGDDFESYRTDCIYYLQKPENEKLVATYFKERNMKFGFLKHK